MELNIRDERGIKIVTLSGELSGDPEDDFVHPITDLFGGPQTRIVIDLSGVPFLNSTALNDLVRVTAQAHVQEARVVLAGLTPFVAGVMKTTQLDRFFDIAPTVMEASNRLS